MTKGPSLYNWSSSSVEERRQALARPEASQSDALRASVREILRAVRQGGDGAVGEFTRRFDGVELDGLRVPASVISRARESVGLQGLRDLEEAIRRVTVFHEAQLPRDIAVETSPGVVCERRFFPIESVGLYVPGGTAPLPSTVVMLGVPSRVAGCSRRALATPPRPDGSIDPMILAAASLVGVEDVFRIGGAQAIAALAFGTETVPKVDKIYGPGNAWVTEAKLQSAQDPLGAACDLPAGPSEVMVIADDGADFEFVASDLLSQAEHGADSQVVLVAFSEASLARAREATMRQLERLPRRSIAESALAKSSFILASSRAEALEICNAYAPEHLILQVDQPRDFAAGVRNAGSVFIGPWSPESVGDYASGTNHVLPTYGYARAYGGLSTESFMKAITFQELDRRGLEEVGPVVVRLAECEGLEAHANAVRLRLAKASRS